MLLFRFLIRRKHRLDPQFLGGHGLRSTDRSPGCQHCYAETFAERFRGIGGHPFEYGFDLRLVPEKMNIPARWTKPRRIFVNSMSDLFHRDVPLTSDLGARLFRCKNIGQFVKEAAFAEADRS